MTQDQTITLTEYAPRHFSRSELPDAVAETLWRTYGHLVTVETPSFKNGDRWGLTAQGWVGVLPLEGDWRVVLQPRVPLHNIFRMIDYAYGIQSLHLLDEVSDVEAVPDLFERLAAHLAQQVLKRSQQGLYRTYQPRTERTTYVQGQLQTAELARAPWAVEVPSHYEEQSVDVVENQLLAWTLHVLKRGGLRNGQARALVERAHRALRPAVRLHPFTADACARCSYNRLNADYRPLHALCAFFLDQAGPRHAPGERAAPAFVVNMARLYEQFVAAWLGQHVPAPYQLKTQEPLIVESRENGSRNGSHRGAKSVRFVADLVLYDEAGQPGIVMDTKYKAPEHSPDTADVQQVIAYAHAAGASQALLIYPVLLPQPLDATVNGIHLQTATFPLGGDLERCGSEFLATLPFVTIKDGTGGR